MSISIHHVLFEHNPEGRYDAQPILRYTCSHLRDILTSLQIPLSKRRDYELHCCASEAISREAIRATEAPIPPCSLRLPAISTSYSKSRTGSGLWVRYVHLSYMMFASSSIISVPLINVGDDGRSVRSAVQVVSVSSGSKSAHPPRTASSSSSLLG
jgi:hypothetical protein